MALKKTANGYQKMGYFASFFGVLENSRLYNSPLFSDQTIANTIVFIQNRLLTRAMQYKSCAKLNTV